MDAPIRPHQVALTTSTVFLLGLFFFTAHHYRNLTSLIEEDFRLVVYLSARISMKDAERVAGEIRLLPNVREVALASGEEAFRELADLAIEMGFSPKDFRQELLPPSLSVTLEKGPDPLAQYRETAGRVRSMDGVAEVDSGEPWLENFFRLRKGLDTFMVAVGLATGIGAALIIVFAVRMGPGSGGAAGVDGPIFFEGRASASLRPVRGWVSAGLMGAGLSLVALSILSSVFRSRGEEWFRALHPGFIPSVFPMAPVLGVVAAGALLGLAGGLTARVRRDGGRSGSRGSVQGPGT